VAKSFNPEVYFHDCYGFTNDNETKGVRVYISGVNGKVFKKVNLFQ